MKRTPALSYLHVAVGVLVCALIPGLSWLDGNGTFAWTMFSKSETFRIGVLVTSSSGEKRYVPPGDLAPYAPPWMAMYLRSSQTWLHSPVGITFRTSLPVVAALGCRLPDVTSVIVTIQERKNLDAPIVATETRLECPR